MEGQVARLTALVRENIERSRANTLRQNVAEQQIAELTAKVEALQAALDALQARQVSTEPTNRRPARFPAGRKR